MTTANAASRATTRRIRAERLEARITAEHKSLIERPVALQGRSETDLVLTSVTDAARRRQPSPLDRCFSVERPIRFG
jgi:Protein of unknown function (DUF1778)